MSVDWSKYPPDWKEIATAIKDATDWKCQVCGKQCYRTGERVEKTQDVLTVAHINHVESDCRGENLVAACAVCHLAYDAERKRWQRLAIKRIQNEENNVLFTSEIGRTVEEIIRDHAVGSGALARPWHRLPADFAEAVEQFKLAIVRRRADNWADISVEEVEAVLEQLKETARRE